MFEHEKGVIVLERPETLQKRRFRKMRIPRAVYERVIGPLNSLRLEKFLAKKRPTL